MSNTKKLLKGLRQDVAELRAGPTFSVADPAFAAFLATNTRGFWGESLTEWNAMGLTAVYRAASIITGTIAGLPLKTYETDQSSLFSDDRARVPSIFDNPAGPFDITPFGFVETIMLHQIFHGESFLQYIFNEGGELVGLFPASPLSIEKVQFAGGGQREFTVRMADGSVQLLGTPALGLTDAQGRPAVMKQILGLTSDSLRGMSMLSLMRRPLQTARSAEQAAHHILTSGSSVSGLVTPDDDAPMTLEDADLVKQVLDQRMTGPDKAGSLAVINRPLKFSPWQMTSVDAELMASRDFSVSEVARMFGVPNHMLAHEEKTTSWGTGVQEITLGFQKYTLKAHTDRLEAAFKDILPPGQHVEFDYHGLLKGTPADEVNLLIAQVGAGLLTKNEARAILNLPPLTAEQLAESAPALTPPPPSTMPMPGMDGGTKP